MDRAFLVDSPGDDDVADTGPVTRLYPRFLARLRIVNYDQVATVFGGQAAAELLAAIHDRAARMMIDQGFVSIRDDGIDILIDTPVPNFRATTVGKITAPAAIEQAFCALSLEPVAYGDHLLIASLAVAACRIPSNAPRANSTALDAAQRDIETKLLGRGPHLTLTDGGPLWAASYVADMRRAVLAYEAMIEDRVFLTWQPIVDGDLGLRVLYSEGQALIADPDRKFDAASDIVVSDWFVPPLERLGLIRAFDAHVVRLAVAGLRSHPFARLGCDISTQSAVVDGWWADIIAELDRDPTTAMRLTLEITETARFPTLTATIGFAREMRRLLCRIAVDHFGRGHMAISDVATLEPDVVKIDAFFLRRASRPNGLTALGHLVGLCRTLACNVVVEGVATKEAQEQAAIVGLRWMQGDFLAAPAMTLRPDGKTAEVPDATATLADAFPKPVLDIPLRHWAINVLLGTGLWGMIGGGLWYVFGK